MSAVLKKAVKLNHSLTSLSGVTKKVNYCAYILGRKCLEEDFFCYTLLVSTVLLSFITHGSMVVLLSGEDERRH